MARYGYAPRFVSERRHRRGRYPETAEFGRVGAGWGYRWLPEGAGYPGRGRYIGEYGRGDRYGEYAGPGYVGRPRYGGEYGDDVGEYRPMGAVAEDRERMGMHDFTERYGRYSGGSPYSYEYSERTVIQMPRFYGARGFGHPFGAARHRRGR